MGEHEEWREWYELATGLAVVVDEMDDLILQDHLDQHRGNPHLCWSVLCRMVAARRRRWWT